MAHYQPCPKCASEQAEAISFTWWGGLVGPKMFTIQKQDIFSKNNPLSGNCRCYQKDVARQKDY